MSRDTLELEWKQLGIKYSKLVFKHRTTQSDLVELKSLRQERALLKEHLINKGYSFDKETLVSPSGERIEYEVV